MCHGLDYNSTGLWGQKEHKKAMTVGVRLSLELHYYGIFGGFQRLLHQTIINLSSSLSIYLPHFESIFSIFLSNNWYNPSCR